MNRLPFSIENILKDTQGAGSILKMAPTSEALALAERMAGKSLILFPFVKSLTENPAKARKPRDSCHSVILEQLKSSKRRLGRGTIKKVG